MAAGAMSNDAQESFEQLKVMGRKYMESLNSSSSRQHRISAQLFTSAVSNIADMPDPIRKPLIRKTVLTCFTRLTNRQSQAAVYLVISALVRQNPASSMKYLAEAYTSFFEHHASPSRWVIANSVLAIKWLFGLCSLIDMGNADVFSSYMLALLSLASHVCASKKFVRMQDKMKIIFDQVLLKTALEWIRNQSSFGANILALLALLPYNNEHFDFRFFINVYTTNTLLAKQRPSIHIVAVSSKIFKRMDMELFRNEILVVIKKSMLRSPEIAIFGVYYLLESVVVDLSSFAVEFYKILSASLISLIDEVRNHTSLSVALIAKRITSAKALKGLVDGVFGTCSGSDGRITTVSQRMTVLETLEMMSCHGVKDKMECDFIASDVLLRLNPLLISEGCFLFPY